MEVVLFLMIHEKEIVNLNIFNMMTRINFDKHKQNIYHVNVYVNLMIGTVIQIKSGTTMNVAVIAKIQ